MVKLKRVGVFGTALYATKGAHKHCRENCSANSLPKVLLLNRNTHPLSWEPTNASIFFGYEDTKHGTNDKEKVNPYLEIILMYCSLFFFFQIPTIFKKTELAKNTVCKSKIV
ncbi:hypothetical protein POVCU2_0036460 [Plasmodium ovale curtisi]|uniref:Uncharacterized protein n=1 Tax=Plasmodium ovale curtisi TaxID=864141 RepID=A0A1A8W0A4_PLAOA|nr:hypothetical protein POVCU2_0036460 [Plasmodium ovale curtisi]SBT00820.1 hypothetical protein POVCU1_062580 [Plasmodium ovale curtisi]